MVRVHSGSQYRVIEESGLSRFVWDEEHAGSNPVYPTEMVSTTQQSRTRKCKIGIWRNWLAYRSDTAGVESSSLSIPTHMGIVKWYHAALQKRCCGFESYYPCIIVLWCNGLAPFTTDEKVGVRIPMELHSLELFKNLY